MAKTRQAGSPVLRKGAHYPAGRSITMTETTPEFRDYFYGKTVTSLPDRFHELTHRDLTTFAITALAIKGTYISGPAPGPGAVPAADHRRAREAARARRAHPLGTTATLPASTRPSKPGGTWPQIAAALDILSAPGYPPEPRGGAVSLGPDNQKGTP